MTRRGDFWGFAGWRRAVVGEDPEGKAPNRLRQALKNRDNGGEAAGPRLKSVGCGKVNGGLRGLDVKGLGSLPIPEGLGLGFAIAGRRAARLRGYIGTRPTARYRVPG